jgi:hypothetical protein
MDDSERHDKYQHIIDVVVQWCNGERGVIYTYVKRLG